jgi:hypothetical protein
MKQFLVIAVAFLIVAACSKDKFESRPTLEIKEVMPVEIPVNGNLFVTLEFTDKEGDVYSKGDSTLVIIRERLNIRGRLVDSSVRYPVPEFPEKTKGELQVTIPYSGGLTLRMNPISLPGNQREIDTLRLGFVLKDQGGNKSDTAYTTVYVSR